MFLFVLVGIPVSRTRLGLTAKMHERVINGGGREARASRALPPSFGPRWSVQLTTFRRLGTNASYDAGFLFRSQQVRRLGRDRRKGAAAQRASGEGGHANVTNWYSCREQIEQCGWRKAMQVAEFLRLAIHASKKPAPDCTRRAIRRGCRDPVAGRMGGLARGPVLKIAPLRPAHSCS